MSVQLRDVVGQFALEGEFLRGEVCNSGHINDTYVVYLAKPDGRVQRYILQRINHQVFKSPVNVMENIQKVTNHLRKRIIAVGGNPERETINLVPARDGRVYYRSPEGEYWRATLYIEGAQTYEIVEHPSHFFSAGKAFGYFQRLLSDFPADSLHETIPNFHNTAKRFQDFLQAVEENRSGRAREIQAEIDFALARAEETSIIVDLLDQGKMPVRVTHNDTKFNNIMIDDKTGEGICVLDLDTVMPGSSLYDFGDAIRSGANSGAEDEQDLSKVWMELSLFEHYTRGFLYTAGDSLTSAELENLAFSAKLITFECGLRFLGDHLNGDTYFRIHRPNHNLDRARTQFKMVADMEKKMGQMEKIVDYEYRTRPEVAASGE